MNNYNFKIIKKDKVYELTDIVNNIYILTREYSFGKNIFWGKNLKICSSHSGPMDNIVIGDNVVISQDSNIMVQSFEMCDYTKINNHFYAYGTHPLKIGYNCWFGSVVILDTLGGLKIGNNVGIGSQSQIYSHAKFGDMLYGCKINSYTPVSIGDDVWIAPNSTITSASMSDKSMLIAGSVLTRPAEENHIYAGVPAYDVTDKIGTQFSTDLDYKKIFNILNQYLEDFYNMYKNYRDMDVIKIAMELPKTIDNKYSYFIVKKRKYIKKGTDAEIAFIKFLLFDKAKFIPF